MTLVHSSWLDRVEWSTTECLGSDHLPILITVDCQVTTLNAPSRTELKWNWKSANFRLFAESVDEAVTAAPAAIHESSLDSRSKFLNMAMIDAANKAIGKVKCSVNGKEWMSRDIREAVKRRNALRRDITNKRAEWIEACMTVRDMIRESKENRWKEFLEDSDSSSNPHKIWSTIKSLSGRNTASIRNETLVHEGREYITNKAKADVFLQRYAATSRLNIPKECRIKNSVRRSLIGPIVEDPSSIPFNAAEMSNAITRMKVKGAPGKDKIHPRFIKAMGPIAASFMLRIFNDSWKTGSCPASWREAIIVPILKKGKPASQIDSFRPVSLTSCVAKTMERMVASRLSFMADSNEWWCQDQAGFRTLRSCEDQVLRLSQAVSDGFQTRPAKRCVLALLDYSKAYDTVWRNRLFQLMMEKGVSRTIVRWIRGFLCDRKAAVRIDGVIGASRKMQQGVPQGAVLSPLLFLFYINGIREEVPSGVSVSMYADDMAIWSQDRDKTVAESKVQEAVHRVSEWSYLHKLKLNTSKCEVSFFTSDTHEAKWIPSITLDNQPFIFKKTPKFLGVTFDRSLSFRPHVDSVKLRVMSRIRILSSLSSKEWGWSRRCMTRIYTALIHSTLHYCGAAWQPWLAKSNVAILERVQNRALRILTGQLADTPLECLRTEAELTSFETQIRRNCIVAWERSARLPAGNPRHKLFTSPIEHKWKRSSFSTLAQAECARIGLDQLPRERFAPKKAPPWNWDREPTWTVDTRLNGGSDKSCDQRTLLTDTVDTIAAAGEVEITIYTDGSAERGYKNGGSAAVVTSGPATDPVKITSITRKGRRLTSSYETEVTAMLLAVGWIKNRENQGPFIICTDSQSTLTALQSPGLSDGSDLAETRRILNSLNTRVSLQWVPGHIGLIGNEWADVEADAVAASDEEPAATDGGITFQTAKAFTKRETMDPAISHERTKAVFNGKRAPVSLSRKDSVLLAQLRSGHCHKLAAYRNIVDADSSATCPHCQGAPETLEHWLQECPATARRRIREFGGAAPLLSALIEQPEAVIAFAHGLPSM